MWRPVVSCWVILFLGLGPVWASKARPNIVLIMTDNHGAWTLGCYGNSDIRTPHLDQLAKDGILFERSYSSNAVCSPTRATYLTGLMPSQNGVHCFLRGGNAQVGPKAYNTLAEFDTLPKILARNGYTCGLTGKWHLGDNLNPPDHFSYWITMPHGATATFYDAQVIHDGKVYKEPTYLTELWTEHAVKFIEQNRQQPFFLFLSYNGPYGLGRSLLNPIRNRFAEEYGQMDFPSFPREPIHPWLHNNREYINNIKAIRRYAAEVSGVDDGVGRVLDTLKSHGLDENTLVIFTGDQGLVGGHGGLWGMGDHTRPLTAYDGTMHVPLIVKHPSRIPAGQKSRWMVSNYDLLPTVLDYLDLKREMPQSPPRPGRSYAAALVGTGTVWDDRVFYDFEDTRAVRTNEWKYIRRYPQGPNELYDLTNDTWEQNNLIDRPELVSKREHLDNMLTSFFEKYAEPKYDLWKDGRSKTHLLSMPNKVPYTRDTLQ